MPFYNPYQGAPLENFMPNQQSGSALGQIMKTWGGLRENKMKLASNQRDREIMDALSRGEQPVPMETPQPSSVVGKLMEMLSGGQVAPGQIPVSAIEKAMAEAQIKAGTKEWKPRTKADKIDVARAGKEKGPLTEREKDLEYSKYVNSYARSVHTSDERMMSKNEFFDSLGWGKEKNPNPPKPKPKPKLDTKGNDDYYFWRK